MTAVVSIVSCAFVMIGTCFAIWAAHKAKRDVALTIVCVVFGVYLGFVATIGAIWWLTGDFDTKLLNFATAGMAIVIATAVASLSHRVRLGLVRG